MNVSYSNIERLSHRNRKAQAYIATHESDEMCGVMRRIPSRRELVASGYSHRRTYQLYSHEEDS